MSRHWCYEWELQRLAPQGEGPPGLPAGGYVADCEVRDISPASKSAAAREELWQWTESWLEGALREEAVEAEPLEECGGDEECGLPSVRLIYRVKETRLSLGRGDSRVSQLTTRQNQKALCQDLSILTSNTEFLIK